MKKKALIIGGCLAGLVLSYTVCRNVALTDRYSKLQGTYEAYLRIAKVDAEILNKTITEKEAAIRAMDKKLATSAQVIGHLTNGIGLKNQELDVLDKNLAVAKTDAERVPILRAEVATWAEKFSLAEQTIAEKDKQIAAWVAKFDAQVTISESWKQKYENEARLHEISRDEISALKTRLISTRLVGTLKSGLIIVAAGYIGYSALKGK